MTFTTIIFAFFFLGVYLLFRMVPQSGRWLVLLLSSYLFYASLKAPYLLLVLFVATAVTFYCGIRIHQSEAAKSKRIWLWCGILANISILFWMKYLPFVHENISRFTGHTFHAGHLLLSIGVSYYTFQAISYLVDIYLEVEEPERHFGYFALYMNFFPKLLQGPIERSNLLPQLKEPFTFKSGNAIDGAHLFLWGLFKKVVVADSLAVTVDAVYQNVHQHSGITLVFATYCFALQIYFDFSGYTDMALGIARFFNIRLTQNFNKPYLATSVADFWRRWHISFSSWILDYIFKPLQLEFRSWHRWGTPLALFITFFISGIWHGASWCFIAWGCVHGVYLGFSSLTGRSIKKLTKRLGIEKSSGLRIFNVVVTFHLVCFAWIFFRAKTLTDAIYVAWNSVYGLGSSFATALSSGAGGILDMLCLPGQRPVEFALTVGIAGLAFILDSCRDQLSVEGMGKDLAWMAKAPFWIRGVMYGLILYLSLFFGTSSQSFIYMQF
jgi:D-alanyl-lipoteichoic acid acyltransferase DltB (MBOAT superfamily)